MQKLQILNQINVACNSDFRLDSHATQCRLPNVISVLMRVSLELLRLLRQAL